MAKKDEKTQRSTLDKLLEKEGISEAELKAILKSGRKRPILAQQIDIGGKSFSYGFFSDPHIGHEKFHPEWFEQFLAYEKKLKPDFNLVPGDHLEGMSGRPGHIYELTHIGFQKQIDYAVELYNQIKNPIFGIDGNHDQWYEKKNNGGLIVGQSLEHRVKGFTNLGQDEGDLEVDGIHIKLYHGGDGTAYADSYKIQKLIESLSGGEKPDIIHSGHYHKFLAIHKRNVWGVESGTLMGQSRWMRGKKIQAATGFGFATVYKSKIGDPSIELTWVPCYEKEKKLFTFAPKQKLKRNN